jgi:ABC-type Na+ efflux pump permease subunit
MSELGLREGWIDDIDYMKEMIRKGEKDVIVFFPDEFLQGQGEALQNVHIWFDSSSQDSYKGFVAVSEVLNSLNPKLFTINADTTQAYDLADEDKAAKEMLALIFPMYILIAVILSSQAIAAESIAGDKERGFLNMMLLAPVKRYTIAVGKWLALMIINAIGSISAFIALSLSLPHFSEALGTATTITYSAPEYVNFFILTISATTLLMSVILLFSTLANSVKQASTMTSVIMIAVMLINMLLGAGTDISDKILALRMTNAYIPLWNSVIGLQYAFRQTLSPEMVLMSCVINIIATFAVLGLIAKMFNSERIVNNINH